MMLIDSKFEFSIPTHIKFTLYKFDHIDSVIISRVMKECTNYSENPQDGIFTISTEEFKECINGSKRLLTEISKAKDWDFSMTPGLKPNSAFFLWSILEKLQNIEWLTFNVSHDRKYSRLVKIEGKEIHSFFFTIVEGVFDMTQVFDRTELDLINMQIIKHGLMENKYLERKPYFYLNYNTFYDILAQMELDGVLNTFDILDLLDPKLEEDNPILLLKTDYTPY